MQKSPLQLVRELIFFAILIIVNMGEVSATAIYVLKIGNVEKGYLIASTHIALNNKWSSRLLLDIDEITKKADDLQMESSFAPDGLAVTAHFKQLAPWLIELIDHHQMPCMEQALNNINRYGVGELLNVSPIVYLLSYTGGKIFIKEGANLMGNTHGTESIDSIVRNKMESQGKSIGEYEGYFESTKYLEKMDILDIVSSIEAHCNKVKTDTFNDDSSMKSEIVVDAIENGNVSLLRDKAMKSYQSSGWTRNVVSGYFPKRDENNAKTIFRKLSSSKNKSLYLSGAIHVGGPDGLIENLKKLGVIVERYSQ